MNKMSLIEPLGNDRPPDFEKYDKLRDKINELVESVNLMLYTFAIMVNVLNDKDR